MEKTKRDSKFELLRILCMLMIIMHHFACHGGYVFDGSISTTNKALIDAFIVGGKIGVNVFVLISGYFLVKHDFKLSKLLKLLLEVCFYSVFIYLLFVLFKKTTFSFDTFIKIALPTITKQYWFVTCYIILYILSPFINKMLKNFDKKDYVILISVLVVLQCIIPRFTSGFLSNQAWFITLYIISAYFRNCKSKIFDNFTVSIITFCVSMLTIICANVFFGFSLWGMKDIVCLICSVSLFCTFKNIKKSFSSKFINTISATTFGVYLIHDNNYTRRFLWRTVLDCPNMAKTNIFILFAFGAVLAVFISCSMIDLIRIYVLEKPLFRVLGKARLSITKTPIFRNAKTNYVEFDTLRINAENNPNCPFKILYVNIINCEKKFSIKRVKMCRKYRVLLHSIFNKILMLEKEKGNTILVRDEFIKFAGNKGAKLENRNPAIVFGNLMCFYVNASSISLEEFVQIVDSTAKEEKFNYLLNYGEVNFETTNIAESNEKYFYGDALYFINSKKPYNNQPEL